MDYNITALVISIIFVAWQVMVWKKIKLPKWIDYITISNNYRFISVAYLFNFFIMIKEV